jgi:hypothetical protein
MYPAELVTGKAKNKRMRMCFWESKHNGAGKYPSRKYRSSFFDEQTMHIK